MNIQVAIQRVRAEGSRWVSGVSGSGQVYITVLIEGGTRGIKVDTARRKGSMQKYVWPHMFNCLLETSLSDFFVEHYIKKNAFNHFIIAEKSVDSLFALNISQLICPCTC